MVNEEIIELFNEQSMQMILHAGNGREKLHKALDLVLEADNQQVVELLNEAKKDINESHKIQTMLVQREAKGEAYYYSMLFAHAQDTLMTTQSEYNLARKIVLIAQRIAEISGDK